MKKTSKLPASKTRPETCTGLFQLLFRSKKESVANNNCLAKSEHPIGLTWVRLRLHKMLSCFQEANVEMSRKTGVLRLKL